METAAEDLVRDEGRTTNDESSPTKKEITKELFACNSQMISDQDESIEEKNDVVAEEEKADQARIEMIMKEVRSRLPPPNPLFPKSYVMGDEPLKIGGMAKFFMLSRFIGRDRADLINDN